MTREELISTLGDILREVKASRGKMKGIFLDSDDAENIIALLKAQEPRVLDWNEIGTVDGVVWLEDRDKSEVVPGLVMQMYSAVNLDIKKDGKLHTASASRSDYGERWRCWTARPTEAQRRETAWPNS